MTTFPANFLWGAATSAYQIEGSPLADGAGENIWHRFSHAPNNIADQSNGDVACDHYRRFRDDVHLMRELGIGAYRFSTSWARVLPEGVGRVNQAGLDFYSRLIDTLLENHIQPMLTLYHWDLPQALEDRGGWADPRSADWFAEYAQLMYRAFDDRVPLWCTINEPWVIVDQGYVEGRHAPGRRDWAEAAAVSKNLLCAHAAAVDAYRAVGKHAIGLVVNLVPIHPASDSDADRQAAQRLDAYLNRQFLDPVLLGEVPPELPQMFGADWPNWTADELRRIRQPIDFVGVNYYLRLRVCDDPKTGLARARAVTQPNCPYTAMGWEIYSQGLAEILLWIKERYGDVPQYITENGAAFDDISLPNGAVDDAPRVQYLKEHLVAARRAIEAGVNLRGYFAWSLLDNFEWQCGYSKRFGLVHVDFATQRRVPKSSARFYSNVIRTDGAALEDKTHA
ncbi:MAG: GH1 family beta-glucosidase [Planctomycetes bacterium]|nr:GH1 family beta-glucosidase [Planctomycetota bacterium]